VDLTSAQVREVAALLLDRAARAERRGARQATQRPYPTTRRGRLALEVRSTIAAWLPFVVQTRRGRWQSDKNAFEIGRDYERSQLRSSGPPQ
jgi:hypothetical protein